MTEDVQDGLFDLPEPAAPPVRTAGPLVTAATDGAARPNPGHRRSHLIATTGAGRAVYESLHDEELTRLDRIADGLDADDINACVRVLAHLVHELGALDALLTPTKEDQ